MKVYDFWIINISKNRIDTPVAEHRNVCTNTTCISWNTEKGLGEFKKSLLSIGTCVAPYHTFDPINGFKREKARFHLVPI